MLLVSEIFRNDNPSALFQLNSHGRVYRAPRGMMYHINNIFVNLKVVGGGAMYILDYEVDPSLDQFPVDAIVVVELSTSTANYVFLDLDVKAKYISVVFDNFSPGDGQYWVGIYGKLFRASTTELIWQWFRRGH